MAPHSGHYDITVAAKLVPLRSMYHYCPANEQGPAGKPMCRRGLMALLACRDLNGGQTKSLPHPTTMGA